jgi:hypothetical protein
MKKEVRKKSIVPIYAVALIFVVWGLFLPLYSALHFALLAVVAIASFFAARLLFPDKITYIELVAPPVTTGDERIDELLRAGEKIVAEMREIAQSVPAGDVRDKIAKLAGVTESIYKDAADDPADYRQVKRFSDIYIPTTMNLLRGYNRFSKVNSGEDSKLAETMTKISLALDSILQSYNRMFDALFLNQTLDIETDITVLENMLKQEGLTSELGGK